MEFIDLCGSSQDDSEEWFVVGEEAKGLKEVKEVKESRGVRIARSRAQQAQEAQGANQQAQDQDDYDRIVIERPGSKLVAPERWEMDYSDHEDDDEVPGVQAIPGNPNVEKMLPIIQAKIDDVFMGSFTPIEIRRASVEFGQACGNDLPNINTVISEVTMMLMNQQQSGIQEESEDVQIMQIKQGQGSSSSSSSSSSSRGLQGLQGKKRAAEQQIDPVSEVLSVFPLATADFVKAKLGEGMDVVTLIGFMAENSYDKVVSNAAQRKAKEEEDKRNTFDFDKYDSFSPTEKYTFEALCQLSNEYPFIQKKYMKIFLTKRHKGHYKPAIDELEKILCVPRDQDSINEDIWSRKSTASASSFGAKSNSVHNNIILLGLKAKSKADIPISLPPESERDPVFHKELTLVQKIRFDAAKVRRKEADEARRYAQAERDGSLVECGCCMSDNIFENCVQCSDGHLFCQGCLNHYCEQTVFGDGHSRIKCMSTTEECSGSFSEAFLEKALAPKVFKKYQEAVAASAIQAANLTNSLVTCGDPECSVQVEMSEGAGNILICPMCSFQTCRLCGEEQHIPLRCSEVEREGAKDLRTRVEEAMTSARLRSCHKCKKSFFKTEGCNKMTCTCGAKMCYVCRAPISAKEGYNHFCGTPNCSHKALCVCAKSGKCVLFSDPLADDRVAMQEAGLTAAMLAAAEGGDATVSMGGKEVDTAAAVAALLEGGAVKAAKKQKR